MLAGSRHRSFGFSWKLASPVSAKKKGQTSLLSKGISRRLLIAKSISTMCSKEDRTVLITVAKSSERPSRVAETWTRMNQYIPDCGTHFLSLTIHPMIIRVPECFLLGIDSLVNPDQAHQGTSEKTKIDFPCGKRRPQSDSKYSLLCSAEQRPMLDFRCSLSKNPLSASVACRGLSVISPKYTVSFKI